MVKKKYKVTLKGDEVVYQVQVWGEDPLDAIVEAQKQVDGHAVKVIQV